MNSSNPFLLLLFSAGCWFLVLNKSARQKVQKVAWRVYGLERQEQKEHLRRRIPGRGVGPSSGFFNPFLCCACSFDYEVVVGLLSGFAHR